MQAPPHTRHFSMRLSTNSPSDLSHRKQRMTDRPHWSTARTHCTGIEEREHSRHRSTQGGLYLSPALSTLPCLWINPPSGAFLQQSLSCDYSSCDTGGECGHISEESPTSDLLHLTFSFFHGLQVFCHRQALLPQHGWNPPAAHRG